MIIRASTICLSALLLTACGGGSDEPERTTKRLTAGDAATLKGPNGTAKVQLEVTAEQGSPADLASFRLTASEKQMTPWYVTSRVKNLGKKLGVTDAVTTLVEPMDDSGRKAKRIALIGDFPKCKLVNAPDPFPAGGQYESCSVYLVAKGRELKTVESTETVFDKPDRQFIWKIG